MNCKETKDLISDYHDNHFDDKIKTSIKEHVMGCPSCMELHQEYIHLISTIKKVQEKVPDNDLELNFNEMLTREKERVKNSNSIILKPKNSTPKSFLKVAATILLIITSYFLGNYKGNTSQISEITTLKQEKTEMLTIATLSLMENESASKRIMAVKYAQELENPDDAILNALINEMLFDKLVNVRLASARALERFSEYNLSLIHI